MALAQFMAIAALENGMYGQAFPFLGGICAHESIRQAINGAKVVAVMDANFSMGSEGAVGLDLKAKLLGVPDAPMVVSYIAGLGGRELNSQTITKLVVRAERVYRSGQVLPEPEWVDLNQQVLP